MRVGEEVLPRCGVLRWSGPEASRRLRALAGADVSGAFAEVVDPPAALRSRAVVGALDVMGALQGLFASTDTDLPRAAFSFASPRGRCPRCKGSGVESVAMDFTADLALPCEACGGTRYRPEVLGAGVGSRGGRVGNPLAALDHLDGQLASRTPRWPWGSATWRSAADADAVRQERQLSPWPPARCARARPLPRRTRARALGRRPAAPHERHGAARRGGSHPRRRERGRAARAALSQGLRRALAPPRHSSTVPKRSTPMRAHTSRTQGDVYSR